MKKTFSKIRENLNARATQPGISLRLRSGLRDTLEAYGEALSLAEAGDRADALEILGEFHAEHRKILVLAEDGVVPEAMVAYSVGLAERLGFDLVLLSVLAIDRRTGRSEDQAREAARPMLQEAARRGVACAHVVRRGASDETLNAVSLELRRVEFVITRRPESARKTSALLVPEFSLKC